MGLRFMVLHMRVICSNSLKRREQAIEVHPPNRHCETGILTGETGILTEHAFICRAKKKEAVIFLAEID